MEKELENVLYATVTQYTYTRNGRPLKINFYSYENGGQMYEIIDFGFVIHRCKTGQEVREYLGAKPTFKGIYKIYHTPVGRSVEKRICGVRVF
jgi:hypothetical protein